MWRFSVFLFEPRRKRLASFGASEDGHGHRHNTHRRCTALQALDFAELVHADPFRRTVAPPRDCAAAQILFAESSRPHLPSVSRPVSCKMTHRHASKQHGCTPTQRFSRLRLTLPRPTRRLVNTCLFQSRTHLAVGADPSRVFRSSFPSLCALLSPLLASCFFRTRPHVRTHATLSTGTGGVAAAARLSTLVLALPCEGPGAAAYRAYLREFRGEVCAPCVAVGSVALTDTRRPAPGVPHFMPLELLHCGPFDSVSLFGVFETIGAPLSETAQPVFEYRLLCPLGCLLARWLCVPLLVASGVRLLQVCGGCGRSGDEKGEHHERPLWTRLPRHSEQPHFLTHSPSAAASSRR